MLKPDFGNVQHRIEWNTDRIAWVRYLVEQKKMTAKEIAQDIGLSANQTPRIFELCRRCNIDLTGQGGRPRQRPAPTLDEARVYSVAVSGQHAVLHKRLSTRHSIAPGRVAELLVNAAFEAGEALCENLLDLETGK